MDEGPFLIDANVLVYLHDEDAGEKHQQALAFMEANKLNPFAFLSPQCLGEFAAVVLRKKLYTAFLAQTVRELLERFGLIYYARETIEHTIELAINYKVPFWDALLAFKRLSRKMRWILSAFPG